MTLYVSESFVNATEGIRFGDTEPYETMFDADEVGKLYRYAQREYGRCMGYVYVDGPDDGEPIKVGWVFVSRQQYEDSRVRYDDWGKPIPPKTYLREVWVQVHEAPDTVVRTPHLKRVAR